MEESQVRSLLLHNLKNYDVNVSEIALKILVDCIIAIKEDPEPPWREQPIWRNVDTVQHDAIEGLTLKLVGLSNRRQASGRGSDTLHTYVILHNISGWVDQICPFAKPEQSRRG
jgi:hypothetical protein